MRVVCIAGGTGSGKTELAELIRRNVRGAVVLPFDAYYRDLSHLPVEERARTNFDHPDTLETALLARHVKELRAGGSVDVPVYDYARHTRVAGRGTRTAAAPRLVVIDGIHALLHDDLLRPDLRVFVDTPDDVRLRRRLVRDTLERGRTPEQVVQRHTEHARPMHDRYVQPTRSKADVVLSDGVVAGDPSTHRGEVVALLRRISDLCGGDGGDLVGAENGHLGPPVQLLGVV